MAVKIRMKRMGRSHVNFFRVNAVDSRFPRDGRVIEELGFYDPQNKDGTKQFVVNLERCKYWLDNGAIPSETVSSLLNAAVVYRRMTGNDTEKTAMADTDVSSNSGRLSIHFAASDSDFASLLKSQLFQSMVR